MNAGLPGGPREARGAARGGLVEIGRVVRLHGVRGEVKVRLHNPAGRTLESVTDLLLRLPDGSLRSAQLRAVRPHRESRLVRFAGVEDATRAEELVGAAVLVRRDQLPPLGEDEFYHVDLIGAEVISDAGEHIGVVAEMLQTGANDVCVVRAGDREVLVPFVASVVERFDPESGVLIIRPIPGLLDDPAG